MSVATRVQIAPPPIEKGRPTAEGDQVGRSGAAAREAYPCNSSDPRPARKSAPTSPFQGEVEQVALPRAKRINARSPGEPAGIQKRLLFGRGGAAQYLVAVREAAEAADDVGVVLGIFQAVIVAERAVERDAALRSASASECMNGR